GLQERTLPEFGRDSVPAGVLAGNFESIGGDVRGDYPGAWLRQQQADGDGAAACADIDYAGRPHPTRRGKRLLGAPQTPQRGLRPLRTPAGDAVNRTWAARIEPFHGCRYQQLSFRTGDQDSRVDGKLQAEEFLEAANVGDGLAGGAAIHQLRVARQLPFRETFIPMSQQARAGPAEDVGHEDFGVQPRRVGATEGQTPGS